MTFLIDAFRHLESLIPHWSLDIRKDIMTWIRVGRRISSNRRLEEKYAAKYVFNGKDVVYIPNNDKSVATRLTYDEIYRLVDPLLEAPITRSYLGMLLRTLPVLDNSWKEALQEGILKELSTSQQFQSRTCEISYPFFESRAACLSIQMHPLLPFRPHVQLELRRQFLTYRLKMSGRTLFPQCSASKTIGAHSSRSLHDSLYANCEYTKHRAYTTADLEKWYMETGGMIEGPSEMRYAWKYNDLKPRIYFAIGSSHYYSARYVWAIFDLLQRVLRSCDPKWRYSFNRFPRILFPFALFVIYDYKTFTSNLKEFLNWCRQFADFMRGVKVWRFDTHHGMVEDDVGMILDVYNAFCNEDPSFSVHRILDLDIDGPVIVPHQVAGLLGVYGNIAASTSLHGILGVMVTGHEDLANTIGDDAGVLVDTGEYTLADVKEAIRVIGEIADEKFEVWDSDEFYEDKSIGWQFVKRPITVSNERVVQEWTPDFPIEAVILGQKDEAHTVPVADYTTRRRLLIKQTCRFFDSCISHYQSLDELDIEFALHRLRYLYRKMELPFNGSYPMRRGTKTNNGGRPYGDEIFAVPPLDIMSFEEGWIQALKKKGDRDGGIITVARTGPVDRVVWPSVVYPSFSFVGVGSKVMSVMEKMRVVERSRIMEDYTIDDYSIGLFEHSLTAPAHYTYTFLDYCPAFDSYTRHIDELMFDVDS